MQVFVYEEVKRKTYLKNYDKKLPETADIAEPHAVNFDKNNNQKHVKLNR